MRLMPAKDLFNFFGFVMYAKTIDNGFCRLVHATNLDIRPCPTEFNYHPIKRVDRRDVAEMGMGYVNHHLFEIFLNVKAADKAIGGGEDFRQKASHPQTGCQ
ncbi:hypothetical protein NB716_003287 [Pantoea ananatis]|nr:hypothetical protein [Pantoea ananatis]